MTIRSILIPIGDDHDEFRVVIHPRGGVNVERREGALWVGHDNITINDAELLAVLRKAGVMIGDLVHKLGDVADAELVEPVAPIMQGFFWTRALDSSYRVHCATGHVLSWHATEASAAAEVACRVAESRPWSTEQILQREG